MSFNVIHNQPIGPKSKPLKHRHVVFSVAVIFIFLLLTIVGVYHLKFINTEYSIDQFFPKKHPLLEQSQKISRTFLLDDRSSFFIVLSGESTWLTPQKFVTLRKLSDSLSNNSKIESVLSLSNIEGAIESKSELLVGPIFDNIPKKKWAETARSQILISSLLISKDFLSTMIVVVPHRMSPGELSNFSDNLIKSLKTLAPGIKIEMGGVPAIQGEFSKKLFGELAFLLTLSLIFICAVFIFLFRGWASLTLTLFCLVVSESVILGLVGYFRVPFSLLLSTLPIIICVALISIMVHSLHRWAEVLHEQGGAPHHLDHRFKLAVRTMKEMFAANFLGSLTTAIGFGALYLAPVPLIQQYGLVVAAAVMIAWAISQVFLLAGMYLTRPRLRGWSAGKSTWTLFILRYPKSLFGGILAATLVLSAFGYGLKFSTKLFDDLPNQDAIRQTTVKIDRDFGGALPYELVIEKNQVDFWKNPQNLDRLDRVSKQLREVPHVGSLITLTDFKSGARLDSKQSVSEFLFLFSMAEKNPLRNFITEDGKKMRLAFRMHDATSDEIFFARTQIKKLVSKTFPGARLTEAGAAVTSHTINQEISRELVFGFWQSLFLIGALLVLVFRSLRWALVACLPNLVPPFALMGVLSLSDTPVKPGVALIFSIALGLAFNNTVYFLSRLKKMVDLNSGSHLPLKRALLQEGNPCLFETLIMFFGFSVFLFSQFQTNFLFGVTLMISILAGGIGDLLFLPALLKLMPGLLVKKNRPQPGDAAHVNASEEQRPGAPVAPRIAAGLVLFFAVALGSTSPARAAGDAAVQILKKVQAQIQSKDEQATVKLKIIESNGEEKVRQLKLKTLKSDKFYAVARIQSPPDLKGTAVLAAVDAESENQWLYLPSSKQVRRVVSGKKGGGLLGSELSLEDLDSTAIKDAQVRVLTRTDKAAVIEIVPPAGTSPYDRVQTSIDLKQFVPVKTVYFQNKKIKKSVEFLKYKKFGPVWRAQRIRIRNLANKRGTELEISQILVNKNLTEDAFSPNRLKKDN